MSAVKPIDPKLTLRFIQAIRNGDVKIVEECIKQGVDVCNYDPMIREIYEDGTAIILGGNGNVIDFLIGSMITSDSSGQKRADYNKKFEQVLDVILKAMKEKNVKDPFKIIIKDSSGNRLHYDTSHSCLVRNCIRYPVISIVYGNDNDFQPLYRILHLFDKFIEHGFDMKIFLNELVPVPGSEGAQLIPFEQYLGEMAKGKTPNYDITLHGIERQAYGDKFGDIYFGSKMPSNKRKKLKEVCIAIAEALLDRLKYSEKYRKTAKEKISAGIPTFPPGVASIIAQYGAPDDVLPAPSASPPGTTNTSSDSTSERPKSKQ